MLSLRGALEVSDKTKILALYLPQFYETNYNSEWWGKGYTEWTACKQAKPLFKGHYQPKLPLNQHFYDLSIKQEILDQVKLAREYGVDGFVIYQYYSCNSSKYGKKNGKHGSMLLNIPTEIIRDNADLDISFCLYWANHDWRKLWFGQDPKMLWKQEYGDESDWVEYFEYNLKYFHDSRYIKLNNKPVFFIFASWHFTNIERFMNLWNRLARENGFDGIYFVKTADSRTSLDLEGFNAVYTREPFYTLAQGFGIFHFLYRAARVRIVVQVNRILKFFNTGIVSYSCDYDKLWKKILEKFNSCPTVIPGAVADWDNSARKGYNSQILLNFNAEKFGYYLGKLYKLCIESRKPFIVINAWNEWAEGAYLEPDELRKCSFLEKIKSIKENLHERISL